MSTASARASAGMRGPGVRSDCWLEVWPSAGGPATLDVKSRVDALYGESIRSTVRASLATLGASDLSAVIEDSGALPFTIMARVEAAVRRLRPDTTATVLPDINPLAVCTSSRDRLRRTRLYLPGNTPKFFINAGLHQPDAVILDLEDSVPPPEKDAARLLVRNALRAVSFYGAERMVRINQLPLGLEDVRMVACHGVDTIVIPKVEDAAQVKTVYALLNDLGAPQLHLLPIVESARGALNAYGIATAAPTVVALAIGLEDYTADIGAQRTAGGRESAWACSQVINAARAAGVQPLASVFSSVDDTEGLRAYAQEARALGFDGVGCIHPRQVRVVHEAFAPADKEMEQAQRILAAFDEATAAGSGVVAVDGRMVDAPVVERARQTLRRAAAGQKAGDAP
jgi:citrate lyase subunit beta / citryl-CoA lyase